MNNQTQETRLNRYEERQEQRKQRYEELANKASTKSTALANRSSQMAECIPFGQPILVGHHSEKRDRNFRSKIHSIMGQAVQEQKKADYYEQKAQSVGKGGISSDDPNAIEKLESKLKGLQEAQDKMKKANKLIKKVEDHTNRLNGLIELGFDTNFSEMLLTPRQGDKGMGFASYSLQNNNAEINRLKKRIEELKALENRQEQQIESDLYNYEECKIENRCMFTFDGKPSEEIRATLKSNGFKWSPSRGAWVRQLNANGIYASKRVMNILNSL